MHKGTILSVDDDQSLQTVLKQYLEGEGYLFLTANSGEQLQEKMSLTECNVILLDLVMPDSDGMTLIPQIKAQTNASIIVVSGKSDTTEKIVCLEMGADDYITKPFEMRELAARIKAAMRRGNTSVAANTDQSEKADKREAIEFDDFILDRQQFQLFDKNKKSLEITSGEFELLEALVMAPNRVLSREQLFELTRDGEFDAYDRAIDIQIGRIRKKLGEKGPDIIRTVRGVGYMFHSPE